MINKYIIAVIFLCSLLIPADAGVYFFPAAFIYMLLVDVKLFRFLFKLSFVLFAVILLVFQPLLAIEKDLLIAGLPASSSGFYNGLTMLMRAVIIIPAVGCLSGSLSKERLGRFSAKLGIDNYHEVVSLSGKLMPSVKRNTLEFIRIGKRKGFLTPVESAARLVVGLVKLAGKNYKS